MDGTGGGGVSTGGVQITTREIYDLLLALREGQNKLTYLVEQMTKDTESMEKRITDLEVRRWPMQAVSGVIALVALAFSIVTGVRVR